ncbi:MAG: nuclear transport factor 2 family protein [Dehalococcoidia bacterium]|nr:MAG: nuclear transport factor 2 family protein [Dehalococcoidia bacterium]
MDVLALERAYWEAMKNGDSEGVERLTDESCIVVGPEGIGEFGPKAAGVMLEDMPYELQSYEIGRDAKVRMLGRNVALVAYPVHESLRRDGRPEVLDAIDASVWVRREGQWVCAMHTETILAPSAP